MSHQAIDPLIVFVSLLPHNFPDKDLYQLFSPYGEIESAHVMVNAKTGIRQRFGFVKFKRAEDASSAVAKTHGLRIGSDDLVVRHANLIKEKQSYPPIKTVRVVGLLSNAIETSITALFSRHGQVVQMRLLPDFTAKAPVSKLAYIRFATLDSATAAVNHFACFPHTEFGSLRVEYAKTELYEKPQEPRTENSSPDFVLSLNETSPHPDEHKSLSLHSQKLKLTKHAAIPSDTTETDTKAQPERQSLFLSTSPPPHVNTTPSPSQKSLPKHTFPVSPKNDRTRGVFPEKKTIMPETTLSITAELSKPKMQLKQSNFPLSVTDNHNHPHPPTRMPHSSTLSSSSSNQTFTGSSSTFTSNMSTFLADVSYSTEYESDLDHDTSHHHARHTLNHLDNPRASSLASDNVENSRTVLSDENRRKRPSDVETDIQFLKSELDKMKRREDMFQHEIEKLQATVQKQQGTIDTLLGLYSMFTTITDPNGDS
ncbi:hypothetical protein BLNAU_17935 [Blattamonas nauphoetae]|uniref:RRM domain-containing protein n=1 Tax=Blattamonas nauphoetae TaxID=2049346 RepID=A0ABQ9X5W0_9EUKA|nr:hypothetical protein BLNAU_17935 [Blattamonas nauphoetae]